MKPDKEKTPCITLIGMAGAGKTTIGACLAKKLDWAFLDSDHMMEALYAARLQDITENLGKEAFLDMECEVVCSLSASRCVLATGGSVVYREKAMRHLASLGPIVHIDLSLEQAIERIARNPERGLAINPGESIEDIFQERKHLYKKAAAMVCNSELMDPSQCADFILNTLAAQHGLRL